jgi:hypothetical protein
MRRQEKFTVDEQVGTVSGENINGMSARDILAKRDSSHHKNKDGFQRADIDVYSVDADATRGREQMLIDYNGGAKSEGGISGNSINGISQRNEKREQYLEAALKIFGGLGILFLLLAILYSII